MWDALKIGSLEKSRPWTRTDIILIAIFSLSVAIFLFEGRSDGAYGDFAHVYGSARCVLSGSNPYSLPCVESAILTSGANPTQFGPQYWPDHRMIYPPLTYYVFAPLAALPYPTAGLILFWISAITLISACVATIVLAPASSRVFVFVAVSAVLATSGGLLRLGQVSTSTLSLLIIANLLFLNRKQPVLAVVLFVLAAALKPQLVLPSLAYFCLPRDTRKYALIAIASFAVGFGVACFALAYQPSSSHWPSDLALQMNTAPLGGVGSRIDTGIINLEGLTDLVFSSPMIFKSIDLVIVATLAGLVVMGFLNGKTSCKRDWIGIAAVSFLTLLLVYHRSYDMRIQILCFPALGLLWGKFKKVATVLTIFSGLLLFSTALIILKLSTAHFGVSITQNLWFRLLVERQQAVIVLFAAIVWALVSAFGEWRTQVDPIVPEVT